MANGIFKLSNLRPGLRGKLIILFVAIKVLPLLFLAWLAWQQSSQLAKLLQQQFNGFAQVSQQSLQQVGSEAVEDSMASLEDRARNEIERLTTDTAKQIAHLLYARDEDILLAATLAPSPQSYQQFLQHRNIIAPLKYAWRFDQNEQQWQQVGVPEHDAQTLLVEDILTDNSRAFNSRPPEVTNHFQHLPLYHEMTFVALDGQEQVKISNSPLLSAELKNISDPHNTFLRAETYYTHLQTLQIGEIYVSEVIGEYIPTHFIGKYTPASAEQHGHTFSPQDSAYAGKENPVGKRFKGIVRWATPVAVDGAIAGYVTLALNHDHIMNITDTIMPTDQRYTPHPDPSEGNYAFIWDHVGRNIAHPRHYFITGYDAETGQPQMPWLEQEVYDHWQQSGMSFAAYARQAPPFKDQSLAKQPAKQLQNTGLRGLDCRFLDFAPQCKGWYDLTRKGGSGSFIIYWSGLWKLVTAASIPYFSGQYSVSPRGFGVVTIGTNIDEFYQPAKASEERLKDIITVNGKSVTSKAESGNKAISKNLLQTAKALGYSTIIMIVLVVIIAFWVASYLSNRIVTLVNGFAKFQSGYHQFRFNATKGDEIDTIAVAFDQMADEVIGHLGKLEQEVERRTESEAKLKNVHSQLENRVQERTRELTLEVAQRQKAELQVRHLAEHDELTGLLNRRGFQAALNSTIQQVQDHHVNAALMLIDLDRFKQVNDSFGHEMGDKLLGHIAQLLIQTTRDEDVVARLGGDEFAIVMSNIESFSAVLGIAERILLQLNNPLVLDSHMVQAGASIGITSCSANAVSANQMLQQADLALYQVKKQGGLQYQVFNDSLQDAASKQRKLERQVVNLLQNEELMLYFQPRYDYHAQRVVGVEALLRPRHPQQGLMDPQEFMDIIERSGLGHQIGIWLLNNVCSQVVRWRDQGVEFGRLSWNLSAKDLNQKGFAQIICATMEHMQVPGDCIEVEITERHKISDFSTFIDNLAQLRKTGITITLDDLGTEYSSLQRMLECDVDVIKIDKYFVQKIGQKKSELVIGLLIDLARKMQIDVIAEGVETQAQLEFLLRSGCSVIQGFYYAKPLSEQEIYLYFTQT
ncbi:MAG: EAL domain-containing protein [Gammaproteobacteria bacterium]|nr:EAL domain-containing protein [Gammaproteobacteria bacterium]